MSHRYTRLLRVVRWTTLSLSPYTAALTAGCTTEPSADTPATLSVYDGPSDVFALTLGAWMALPVQVHNRSGASLPLAEAVRFASRDTTVVTVDGAGRVTSRGMGETWVVGTLEAQERRLADSVRVAVLCTSELTARVTPVQPIIAVGQEFTPSVELRSCGGRIVVTDEFTWAASDTTVARVDASTGRTVGRAPGRALVRPTGRRYGQVGWIDMTVTPLASLVAPAG